MKGGGRKRRIGPPPSQGICDVKCIVMCALLLAAGMIIFALMHVSSAPPAEVVFVAPGDGGKNEQLSQLRAAKKERWGKTLQIPVTDLDTAAGGGRYEDTDAHEQEDHIWPEGAAVDDGKHRCTNGLELQDATVFWKDLPFDRQYYQDMCHKKTGGKHGHEQKYLSFEYDHGGWNNIRMGYETTLVIAMATCRKLVIPPEQDLYLLNKDADHKKHSFWDFYDFDALNAAFPGAVIKFDDFVELERANLKPLPDNLGGKLRGPGERGGQIHGPVWDYLRDTAHAVKKWDGGNNCLYFPENPLIRDHAKLPQHEKDFVKLKCKKKKPILIDEEFENALLVHLPVSTSGGYRLLVHFYGFVYFADTEEDHHFKRLIRDNMHYTPEIFCFATEVIEAMQRYSRSKGYDGKYNSFHIRRNEFQFKEAWVDANHILGVSKDVMEKGSPVYIATDEKNRVFFKPLTDHYDVKFLDDFITDEKVLNGVNKNYFGMIEQIVAANGDTFIGTWWSTFTGYIMRMRGYMGRINQSFYYPKNFKMEMQKWAEPNGGGWWREWPTAWTDIDRKGE